MSKLLSISCERIDQPAEDRLEEQTWAALRIYVAGRCVTRWLERESQQELDTIYVPAFPLARWVAVNWWALLHEPCREDLPPVPDAVWTARGHAWMNRHCLRSAESGMFLPRLSMWNDGRYFNAHWVADQEDSYPTMPGSFLYGSSAVIDHQQAEDALRSFVETVLRWVEGNPDPRAARLRDNWKAIINADIAETAYCRAAGHMGLDPYELSSWPAKLADLLEQLSGEDASPITTDFWRATTPEAASTWDCVERARKTDGLGPAPNSIQMPIERESHAGRAGVVAPQQLRHKLSITDNKALPPVREIAKK